MTIEDIRDLCLGLKAVTEDIKWENHLCFSVGGKMFIITSPDEVPPTASFRVSDEDFDKLTQRAGIIPAPYLARYKWVMVEDIDLLTPAQWKSLISEAHTLVAKKLSTRQRTWLGFEE
jgi:predicted DNA-binding protein (MmcQ/YjbR family)